MWDVGIFGAGRPERAFSTELLIYSEIVSNWAKIWHLRLPLIKINVSKPQYSTITYHTIPCYTVPCYIIQYHAKDTTTYYYPKYEIQSNEREKCETIPISIVVLLSLAYFLCPWMDRKDGHLHLYSPFIAHLPLTLCSCQASLTTYNWAACCWIK